MNNQTTVSQDENPLGAAPVGSLIARFAIPAVISMLVSAFYNIVDQIFIGQGVGMLGNAATNIAFPVTIISTAAALLLGIGSASNYNLEMGAGHVEGTSLPIGGPGTHGQLHRRNRTFFPCNLRHCDRSDRTFVPETTASPLRRNTGRYAIRH